MDNLFFQKKILNFQLVLFLNLMTSPPQDQAECEAALILTSSPKAENWQTLCSCILLLVEVKADNELFKRGG